MQEKLSIILKSILFLGIGIAIGAVGVIGYYDIFNVAQPASNQKGEKVTLGENKALNPENIGISEEKLKQKLGNNFSEKDIKSAAAYLKFKKIRDGFVHSGVPNVYGKELGVSFDKVQNAINKVQIYGPDYGEKGIELAGGKFERYKSITSQTSCEYCCGARALIREDGSAACGCAHSVMMRGLAAYLLQNYPSLSDEEILNELNKWKRTFFPKQTLTAYLQQLQENSGGGADQILKEFPGFMPNMVGGC